MGTSRIKNCVDVYNILLYDFFIIFLYIGNIFIMRMTLADQSNKIKDHYVGNNIQKD